MTRREGVGPAGAATAVLAGLAPVPAGEPPRVAVIVPATDTGVEIELPGLVAGRASIHVARARLDAVTVADLLAMEHDAVAQAAALAPIRPVALVLGCTSASFVRGRANEAELAARLAEAAGAPVILTAQAMAAGLRRRGSRVRLRASYTQDIVDAERAYLESYGLDVVSAEGLGITEDEQTARVGADELVRFATTGAEDGADVVMLSCTNLRTAVVHEELERRIGLPVLSSNRAMAESLTDFLDGHGLAGARPDDVSHQKPTTAGAEQPVRTGETR
ncbi:hypothetical protein FE374_01070 [Georgenia yuyongxinii]|uniref:Maleate isomerase n=1 Tax=Georgenia yuyongxinii TaxID=2589797 RepID=A0A5B8C5Z1_9MICO|nr:aspartate/glutamate racemase family protein [Georgenia yuyongxinii]QDC23406.1 hypothetical protein FE374_01070 [Georgenia yuyongxinii]